MIFCTLSHKIKLGAQKYARFLAQNEEAQMKTCAFIFAQNDNMQHVFSRKMKSCAFIFKQNKKKYTFTFVQKEKMRYHFVQNQNMCNQ